MNVASILFILNKSSNENVNDDWICSCIRFRTPLEHLDLYNEDMNTYSEQINDGYSRLNDIFSFHMLSNKK